MPKNVGQGKCGKLFRGAPVAQRRVESEKGREVPGLWRQPGVLALAEGQDPPQAPVSWLRLLPRYPALAGVPVPKPAGNEALGRLFRDAPTPFHRDGSR